MFRKIAFLSFLTALTISVSAQKPSIDPSQKPRKAKSEISDAHKKWAENDAIYILTPEEKRAFYALTTDEERENFIALFWQRRDPDPDTEENEYREEYYERIAYANEHFTSGIPGWKTDRGRIYIKWGKPDSIESRPSGGAYDRPSYQGGGSTTTYPFEIWFYRHLDNVGDGIEIEFVDRTGTGEYRIARSPDEKDALATVPVGNRSTGEDQSRFVREQDSQFRRQEILAGLEKPPSVKFADLLLIASGGSAVIDSNPVDFNLRIDFFRQSDDRVASVFTVQADNKEFQFRDNGGVETATINILGRITAVSGKRSGIFEDSVTATATSETRAETQSGKSIYQKTIVLPPGTYKVAVAMRDVNTGNKGLREVGFAVPRYDAGKLSTSTMVLTSKLRTATDREIGQMFVMSGAKVVPHLSGVYKQGQEVGVYLQVYNAGIDQTTLRPAVDVEYVLLKSGKEVLRQTEDWNGLSDSGQRLTLARLLPTDRMPVGEYEVKVLTKDKVGGQVIENKSTFSIVQ